MRALALRGGGPACDELKTSHFTGLGGPATNKHFTNSFRGGNRDFHMGDKFMTSNEAFYGKGQMSARRRGEEFSPLSSSRSSTGRSSSAMSHAGRSAVDRMSVTDAVTAAISMGAPTFNSGDHMGCFDIYRNTAQSLMERQNLAYTDRTLLRDGMQCAQMVN